MPAYVFRLLACCVLIAVVAVAWADDEAAPAQPPLATVSAAEIPALRREARELIAQSLWREALAPLSAILRSAQPDLDEDADAALADDYRHWIRARSQLSDWREVDEQINAIMASHPRAPALGVAIMRSLSMQQGGISLPRHGHWLDGQVWRGHAGQGQWVDLQLWSHQRALHHGQGLLPGLLASEGPIAGRLLLQMAEVWANHPAGDWALRTSTDLETIAPPEIGQSYFRNEGALAAVDDDGRPLAHDLPQSWDSAASDGERWRWLLAAAVDRDPGLREEAEMLLAVRAEQWWGVSTLTRGDDLQSPEHSQAPALVEQLEGLGDHETLARLATGIQRFDLAEEWNYLHTYRRWQAWDSLARVYANRHQLPQAAATWKLAGNQHEVERITKPWLYLGATTSQVLGRDIVLPLRFRNASAAQVQVQPVRLNALRQDLERRLARGQLTDDNGNPQHWERSLLGSLHYRLVTRSGGERWLGAAVAAWREELDPDPVHRDRIHSLTFSLDQAGAYLVTAEAEDGNVSRALLWVADTIMVQMPTLEDDRAERASHLVYLADARDGRPLPDMEITAFGHRNDENWRGQARVRSTTLRARSDAQGLALLPADLHHHQWIITARDAEGERLLIHETALSPHYGRLVHNRHQRHIAHVITDRPLYRPQQRVQGKVWLARPSYAEDAPGVLAGAVAEIRIIDPRGEEVLRQNQRSDDWGGITFAWEPPLDATLGQYTIYVRGPANGHGRFRLEEFRSPEFSVSVQAPTEPVTLGDTITARIEASYLWGQPVRGGEVTYTVTRAAHHGQWFPPAPWDWLYGPGYWWRAQPWSWLDGWQHWYLPRPAVQHHAMHHPGPAEVVASGSAELDAAGGFDLRIDSAAALASFGARDQRYTIAVTVRDASRRTEMGGGSVIAQAQAFRVLTWADRGFLSAGDGVTIHAQARSSAGQGIAGRATLRLHRLHYAADGTVREDEVDHWQLESPDGSAIAQRLRLPQAGQYRAQVQWRSADGASAESSHLLTVIPGQEGAAGLAATGYRFTDLEILPDRDTYAPGDEAALLIASSQPRASVLLMLRPERGVYTQAPQLLRLDGGAALHHLAIVADDQPNIFVEAVTVHGGRVHRVLQQIAVPPLQRHLQVAVTADASRANPGSAGNLHISVHDADGQPQSGSAVVTIYDAGLDLLAGDVWAQPIHQALWSWRRHHHSQVWDSLRHGPGDLRRERELGWTPLGIFGPQLFPLLEADPQAKFLDIGGGAQPARARSEGLAVRAMVADADQAPAAAAEPAAAQAPPPPTMRSDFADSILWVGTLALDGDGRATIPYTLADNLTTWRARVITIGPGAAAGEGSTDIIAAKDLALRLHLPRFAVEGDHFTLSLSIHNDHAQDASGSLHLNIDGEALEILGEAQHDWQVAAGSEQRIDIPLRARGHGTVHIEASTSATLADGSHDGDALRRRLPLTIYGSPSTQSESVVIAPQQEAAEMLLQVPEERIEEATRLTVRWSPTVAGAAIEAIPYLAEFPYGCTEQTLNRFVPALIAHSLVRDLGLDLDDLRRRRSLLNPGQLGSVADRDARAARQREHNPVYDPHTLRAMVLQGLKRLGDMQVSDGGWGWFSGYGQRSYPHTTAVVVRGLLLAEAHGERIPGAMRDGGIRWLTRYQQQQVAALQAAVDEERAADIVYRERCSALDAFVYLTLVEADVVDPAMEAFLIRDGHLLPIYSQALLGLALHHRGLSDERDQILRRIAQFVERRDDNDTAWLRLSSPWWYWYGAEYEATSAYLSLLVHSGQDPDLARGIAKYLVNSRRGRHWNSTRDTAWAVEALVAYARDSGELDPDQHIHISLDGTTLLRQHLTRDNLFAATTTLELNHSQLAAGTRRLRIERSGAGPLYANAWLEFFTQEKDIPAQGQEITIRRKFWRITTEESSGHAIDAQGRPLAQRQQRELREALGPDAQVNSGDLIEVELIIDSANNYEYLLIEDRKFAGAETLEQRSGYAQGAYVEYRDDRVALFLHHLPRGTRSLSYRLRAETPATLVNALPATVHGMYAPELVGNSSNRRFQVRDQ